MKRIATVLFSSAIIISPLAFNSQAEASTPDQLVPAWQDELTTVNELVPTIPTESDEMGTYGAKPPSSGASVHDLTVSPYNYQVQKVGAQVYTDKFVRGKTQITVTVENFTQIDKPAGYGNELEITLFDSSKKQIGKALVHPYLGAGSATFYNLSASTQYYVKFSVPINGNTFSFNGMIK